MNNLSEIMKTEEKKEYIYVGLPGFPMIQFEMTEREVIEYYEFCRCSVIDWKEGWKKIISPGMKDNNELKPGVLYMWHTNHAWEEDIEEDEYDPGKKIYYRMQNKDGE